MYLSEMNALSRDGYTYRVWFVPSTAESDFRHEVWFHYDQDTVEIELTKDFWLSCDLINNEASISNKNYSIYKPELTFLDLKQNYKSLLGKFYDLIAMLFETEL